MSKKDINKNEYKVYRNSKGEVVFRISEIIKVLAKDQLILWANMLGFKNIKYSDEISRTSKIGTMMHAVIEKYMKHNPYDPAIVDFDEYEITDPVSQQEAMNAIESFFKWYKNVKSRYVVKFTEQEFVGEKYGGTIDCGIAGFDDPDKIIFVDYKSSGFYLSQFLQLGGYVRLYEEVVGPDTVEGIMIIAMDKKKAKPAKARYIRRDKLEPILIGFDCLYNVALMTKMLNVNWWNLGEYIE